MRDPVSVSCVVLTWVSGWGRGVWTVWARVSEVLPMQGLVVTGNRPARGTAVPASTRGIGTAAAACLHGGPVSSAPDGSVSPRW